MFFLLFFLLFRLYVHVGFRIIIQDLQIDGVPSPAGPSLFLLKPLANPIRILGVPWLSRTLERDILLSMVQFSWSVN